MNSSASSRRLGLRSVASERDLYCSNASRHTRADGAFIIARLGEFNPPSPPLQRCQRCSGVRTSSIRFINEMALRAITVGCDPQVQCTARAGRHAEQMAAFMIARSASSIHHSSSTALWRCLFGECFLRVLIDQMAIRGITVGCNPGRYVVLPSDGVTREQMAGVQS
jgi:hypothetical protein